MLSDIEIDKDYPIVNGFVQVPPNLESAKNTLTVDRALELIPGAYVVELSLGSGNETGSNSGTQKWLRVPGQPIDCCHIWTPDPAVTLATPRPDPPTFAMF